MQPLPEICAASVGLHAYMMVRHVSTQIKDSCLMTVYAHQGLWAKMTCASIWLDNGMTAYTCIACCHTQVTAYNSIAPGQYANDCLHQYCLLPIHKLSSRCAACYIAVMLLSLLQSSHRLIERFNRLEVPSIVLLLLQVPLLVWCHICWTLVWVANGAWSLLDSGSLLELWSTAPPRTWLCSTLAVSCLVSVLALLISR